MSEIAKLEEVRQQLEKALDGLDLFLDVWGEYGFKLQPDGEAVFISPLKDLASDEEWDVLERMQENGRAYLDGMKCVIDTLADGLKENKTISAEERSLA